MCDCLCDSHSVNALLFIYIYITSKSHKTFYLVKSFTHKFEIESEKNCEQKQKSQLKHNYHARNYKYANCSGCYCSACEYGVPFVFVHHLCGLALDVCTYIFGFMTIFSMYNSNVHKNINFDFYNRLSTPNFYNWSKSSLFA